MKSTITILAMAAVFVLGYLTGQYKTETLAKDALHSQIILDKVRCEMRVPINDWMVIK